VPKLDKKSLHSKYYLVTAQGKILNGLGDTESSSFEGLGQDCFAFNNLLWRYREAHIRGKKISTEDFKAYKRESADKEKAKTMCHMTEATLLDVGNWKAGEWRDVGKYTGKLLGSYERAKAIWRCLELYSDAKAVWTEIADMLEELDSKCEPWPLAAGWTLDEEEEIKPREDQVLGHLAPLQQTVAATKGDQVEKEMIMRMNRIMQDIMFVSGTKHEEQEKMLEDVWESSRGLIQVSFQ
jgi:hypothetical protein